ncbi:MAG: MotA/TolQ/ExbB proton channel family protein [Burkholderiaceae bacterium]
MNPLQVLSQGDAVSRTVALLLLLMSVASWGVILVKLKLLGQAGSDTARATAAFWQAASLEEALQKVPAFDRQGMVTPLIAAAMQAGPAAAGQASLARTGDKTQQLTRLLRDALHQVLRKLQFGQVLLATVGAISPFVGLLGTVWGIYQALAGISSAGQITIDQIAGPVGEALIMTAAGLAVAIPAVLAYNVYGRMAGRVEADLEGFARDLRDLLAQSDGLSAAAPSQGGKGPSGGSAAPAVACVGATPP